MADTDTKERQGRNDEPAATIGKEWDKKAKTYRPVLHVMFADGRTTEFCNMPVVIPESSNEDTDEQVLAKLVNGKGEPYVDTDGQPILLQAIPFVLAHIPESKELWTWKEAAKLANTSLSSLKRAVQKGEIELVHLGGNDGLPRIKNESLRDWMNRHRGEKKKKKK